MILGIYWMTIEKEGVEGEGKAFCSADEAINLYNMGGLHPQAKVKVKVADQVMETTLGRVIFNQHLPEEEPFFNETIDNKKLVKIIKHLNGKYSNEVVTEFLDAIKDLGYEYATKSGLSLSMDDGRIPEEKAGILEDSEEKVIGIREQYAQGFITEEERQILSYRIWEDAKEKIQKIMEKNLDPWSFLTLSKDSGARG
jgi:DNA-directed RNA polymerase subunit beta'